jgi:hypothetical protein
MGWALVKPPTTSGEKKYGRLGATALRQLKPLAEENQHLKQLVADLSLDKQILQDVLKHPFEAHATAACGYHLINACRFSARRVCRSIGSQWTIWFYKAHGRDETLLG